MVAPVEQINSGYGRLWRRTFTALIIASSFGGCGTYQTVRGPQVRQICTEVTFAPPVDVIRICEKRGVAAIGVQACASVDASNGWHWIVVPKPTDFNDRGSIELLGHEMLHNLGATHR